MGHAKFLGFGRMHVGPGGGVGFGWTRLDSAGLERWNNGIMEFGESAHELAVSEQKPRAPVLNRFFIKMFWRPARTGQSCSQREQHYLELLWQLL